MGRVITIRPEDVPALRALLTDAIPWLAYEWQDEDGIEEQIAAANRLLADLGPETEER